MPKWVMNYESGEYEWIDENGYSWDQGCYVYNWDDSEYRREEEEEHRRFQFWHSLFDSDDD